MHLLDFFRNKRKPLDTRSLKLWDEVEPVLKGSKYVCPACGCQDFFEGPEGGLAVNVECVGCHRRWNANSVGLRWQFIGQGDAPAA